MRRVFCCCSPSSSPSSVCWSVSTLCKYGLHVVDGRLEGRWQGKSLMLFYLELVSDVVRLLLYLCFFMLICTYYGLPLHLIRELAITFYNLRERVVKFVNYRRITANMNQRFPDCTREELEAGDDVCIICREQMTSAKRLQCGHCFHTTCLITWIERSSSCPTCRANIAAPASSTHTANTTSRAAQPNPTLPPLPPHLQAHIDQHRATRGANDTANNGRQQPLPLPSPNNHNSDAAAGQVNSPAGEAAQHNHTHTQGRPIHSHTTSAPTATQAQYAAATGSPPLSLSANQPAINHSRFAPFPPVPSAGHNTIYAPHDSTFAASATSTPHPTLPSHLPANFTPFTLPPYNTSTYAQQAWQHSTLPSPLDPAYLAAFTHHTLTLQIHMELLESELRQLRMLWDRQVAVQDIINQQQIQQQAASDTVKKEEGSDESANVSNMRRRTANRRDDTTEQSTASQSQATAAAD